MTQDQTTLSPEAFEPGCESLETEAFTPDPGSRPKLEAVDDAARVSPPVAPAPNTPRVIVIGVGGAGGNAVNTMIRKDLAGVEYLAVNTDAQALAGSLAEDRLQLGVELTRGLGAGGKPEIGFKAAEESAAAIAEALKGAQMIFIAAGMGGGTGTGAAPAIARIAREMGVLTVGVVSKPFDFEGPRRRKIAEEGAKALAETVDSIIVIPNQNLFRVANDRTTFAEAFQLADEVLHQGVKGVTDLMIKPGLVNLDFADVRAVIDEMGAAMMGSGEATGEDRAREAAEQAVDNPLLDEVTLRGAKGVLINVVGGPDLKLYEVDAAANRVRQDADPEAAIFFGSTIEPEMEGRIRVSVVATGVQQRETVSHHVSSAARAESQSGDAAGGAAAEGAASTPDAPSVSNGSATAAPAETPVPGETTPRDDLVRKMAQSLVRNVDEANASVSDAVSSSAVSSAGSSAPRGVSRPAREGSRVEIPSFLRRQPN